MMTALLEHIGGISFVRRKISVFSCMPIGCILKKKKKNPGLFFDARNNDFNGDIPGIMLISKQCYKNKNILYNICTMPDQRQRRWAEVLQMLYKCSVFARNRYAI